MSRWVLVECRDGRRSVHPLNDGELNDGELLVGSGARADLQLDHPTVSRRHAALRLTAEGVSVQDLGSSNGTFVDGTRLHGSRTVEIDTALQFGSLSCALERVEPQETEAAIQLDLAERRDLAERGSSEQVETEGAAQTLSVGSVREFVTDALPDVVGSLESFFRAPADQRAAASTNLVQTAGRALFLAFPCRRLEILHIDGPEPALLFHAALDEPPIDARDEWTEVRVGSLVTRALFPAALHTRGIEPLVELVSRLAALTVGDNGVASRTRPRDEPPPLPQPATVDPAMLELYEEAARIARGEVSVLIHGETGTGKEVLARYIHDASPRRQKPWVAINCAALPGDLLEAELFGIEKGVATGVEPRAGKFEQADGGTLFLDEIGDMAVSIQAKILRVLQEGHVYRLGGKTTRPARARILAATNQDLSKQIADGTFRLDLFHRIADCRLTIPPLRDRPGDLPSLAAYFLTRAVAESGTRPRGISRAALDVLASYPWPGNVRQLEREMARAALFLADGELLQTRHLQPEIIAAAGADGPSDRRTPDRQPQDRGPQDGRSLKARLDEEERRILIEVLAYHDGSVRAAAIELGIGRTTLYRRLGELSIEI